MKRGILAIVGFLLIATGFIALILSLLGLQLSFLTWIDSSGKLLGFIIRLLMIMGGFLMMIIALGNSEQLEEEQLS